jgi:predicted nucleic acid-binding protein
MNIIVDTSVWSLAFRKKDLTQEEVKIVKDLSELVKDLRVVMIGPIRQEILSGISSFTRFDELKERLSVFIDHSINTLDYELAAQYYNKCRKNGIQGSHIDFLICSVASNGSFPIFTLDNDFRNYKKYLPIELYNWNK